MHVFSDGKLFFGCNTWAVIVGHPDIGFQTPKRSLISMDQEDHGRMIFLFYFFSKVTLKICVQNISWITVELKAWRVLLFSAGDRT